MSQAGMSDGAVSQQCVSKKQIAAAISSRLQELILLPTERCNLRCTYCYEDFKIGRMSPTTQRAVERFVEARADDLRELRFSWFGGEPLMAKDIVLRLSRHAKSICDERGIRFRGGLTTNAYHLDRDTFENLLGAGQDFFQITLDGWKKAHDEVRRFADGRGSFDRIWANLLAMKDVQSPFEILLRIHVRRENIEGLDQLIDEIAKAFGSDARFRMDFEHVRDLGGEGGLTVKDGVTVSELGEIEWKLRQQFYQACISVHGDSAAVAAPARQEADEAFAAAKISGESAGSRRLEDIDEDGGYICYASKPNSLLVRADGRIGKCTVALNDVRNDIGHLNEDGTVSIDHDRLRPWLRGFQSLDEAVLGCPLSGLPSALQTEIDQIAVHEREVA